MRNSLLNRLIFVFGMLGLMFTPLVAHAAVHTYLDQDITNMEDGFCGTYTKPNSTCVQQDAVAACREAFTGASAESFPDILSKWCQHEPSPNTCPATDPTCKPQYWYICAINNPNSGDIKVYDWINNTFKKSPAYLNANATCGNPPPTPPQSVCGDGVVNQPDEECDGGNGCSSTCKLVVPSDVNLSCYQGKHDYCKESIDYCFKNNVDPAAQCAGKLPICLKDAMDSCSSDSKALASLGGKGTGPAKISGDASNGVSGGGCSNQLVSPNSASGGMNTFILLAFLLPAMRFKLRR